MIPYRCHSCHTRHVRRKLPLDYARDPVCRYCGHKLAVDRYRLKGQDKSRKTCYCAAAPFPHRRRACERGWYYGRPKRDAIKESQPIAYPRAEDCHAEQGAYSH